MTTHCINCRAIRERSEELEEQVRQLKALAHGEAFMPPMEWRLTPTETVIVQTLCALAVVDRNAFVSAMEGHDPHWCADIKIFDVYICKLRHKLAPYGVSIETLWGRGYYLSAAHRAAVRAACGGGAARIGPPIERDGSDRTWRRASVLSYLEDNPDSTVVQVAQGLKIGQAVVQNWLSTLMGEGAVKRSRAKHWKNPRQPPFLYRSARPDWLSVTRDTLADVERGERV